MGGRGASSGIGRQNISGLPEVQKPIENFPELQGSEKQIAWATDIRQKIYNTLLSEMKRNKEGNRTEAIKYIFSKKDMEKWVRNVRETFGEFSPPHIVEERVKDSIESLQTAAKQYKALKTLIETETSAKFWIEHRNTHPRDLSWSKLKKSVIGY